MNQKQRFRLEAARRLLATAEPESASYGTDAIEEAVRDNDKQQGTDSVEESADASPSLYNISNPVPNGMM